MTQATLSSGSQQLEMWMFASGQHTHRRGLPPTCSWRTGTKTPVLDALLTHTSNEWAGLGLNQMSH